MSSLETTILIVDDEAVVRRVLSDALIQVGYRTRVAGSRDDALVMIEHEPPDLVLLDLQLGEYDGIELLRVVRQRYPALPTIILTAHGSLSSAIEAVRLDASDYLLKPIGVEPLRARVAEVLGRSRVAQQRQERIKQMYQQLQALVHDEGLVDEPARKVLAGPIYTAGPISLDVQRHLVRMSGQQVEVTPTEFAILQTLVREPGTVVPCVQLIRSFQQVTMDEDEARQVMRPHIVRLRRKIEPDPQRPIYIQSVRGVGYRWGSTGDSPDDEA